MLTLKKKKPVLGPPRPLALPSPLPVSVRYLAVGELHEVARHVREARGRHVVPPERRGVPAGRVEPARHQHYVGVVLLE